jgi:hypothetical protein
MTKNFDKASQGLRPVVQALENGEGDYTRDMEAFINGPLMESWLETVDQNGSSLNSDKLAYGDTRSPERVEEELEYWAERFGWDDEDPAELPLPELHNLLTAVAEADENLDGVDLVIAPAVGGVIPGNVAAQLLEADVSYVGYSEDTDYSERDLAFATEELEGETALIVDDTMVTGASAAGIEAETDADEIYVTDTETGNIHEVQSWTDALENTMGEESPDGDKEFTDGVVRRNFGGRVSRPQNNHFTRDETLYRAAGYGAGLALMAVGAAGVLNGPPEIISPELQEEAELAPYSALGIGATILAGEYKADLASEYFRGLAQRIGGEAEDSSSSKY